MPLSILISIGTTVRGWYYFAKRNKWFNDIDDINVSIIENTLKNSGINTPEEGIKSFFKFSFDEIMKPLIEDLKNF